MRRPTITFLLVGGMLAAGTMVLAGCGERQTVRGESGDKVEITSGATARASNVDLPAFLPLYPGARVEHTLGGVSSGAEGARKGGMVVFHTADAPEKVAAFYRGRLDGSGLGERSDANLNGVLMLTAAATEDADRSVQASIAPAEEGGSRVTLVYSQGGA